ncbi:MAG: response regulator [Cyanobacteria bacterium J06641_5]
MKFVGAMLEEAPSAIEYRTNQLSGSLADLQHDRISGAVYFDAVDESGVAIQRTLVLREGALVYAGPAIPTPQEFVRELSNYLEIGVIDTVLKFAAKRSSVQQILATMVQIEVLQWPDIVAGMRKQAIAILKELLTSSGRMTVVPDASTFDLRYDAKASWFSIDALLLEIALSDKGEAIPRSTATAEPISAKPGSYDEALERRPTILCVDDSPIARALIKRTLGKSYQIKTCSSAADALNYLHQGKGEISLMLLDLTMPDIDGLELCRMIRKTEKFKGLPIIMLTARDGMMSRMRGHLAGTTDYLAKPVKPAELIAAVAQYAI